MFDIPTVFRLCPLYSPANTGYTNSGGNLDITINVSNNAVTNYSSSLVFLNPAASDNLTNVPWATITSGGTGTVGGGFGTATLRVNTPAGYSGIGESNTYTRSVLVRIFQEKSGVMENIGDANGCTIQQQYNVQIQSGNQFGEGIDGGINIGNDLGGITNPIQQQP